MSATKSGVSKADLAVLEEYDKLKADRKRSKLLRKAGETLEEKRQRRLAKKASKESAKRKQLGWDEEYAGYTNEDNPFADSDLLKPFVWSKKLEKEGSKTKGKEMLAAQRKRIDDNRAELDKVKRRRRDYESQKEEMDKEKELMQRQKEMEYFREWEKQEDTFHLNQAKLRSNIRIEDGRAKPIDMLAKYINEEELSVETVEPYLYLENLSRDDLEDLVEDIRVYSEMDEGTHNDYWADMTVIVKDELAQIAKRGLPDRRDTVNSAVAKDVSAIFQGKSAAQLTLLGEQIRSKLESGAEGVDTGYWESLLEKLKAFQARMRLKEKHAEILEMKLGKLKAAQGITAPSSSSTAAAPADEAAPSGEMLPPSAVPAVKKRREDPADETVCIADYEYGCSRDNDVEDYDEIYSPPRYDPEEANIEDIIYDPEEDMRKLEFMRGLVNKGQHVQGSGDDEFLRLSRAGMTTDEAAFSVEADLGEQHLLWSDKYRPRKPRFFNRVHTGWDWNKYNQTHYDIDNPPPKIVQGYKFNIFYPDLIDKSRTPEYTITVCAENSEFVVLRFKAGAPYEDLAFKIVNREWDTSYRHGFRCQFQNNIFQLWFHFQRLRYRK